MTTTRKEFLIQEIYQKLLIVYREKDWPSNSSSILVKLPSCDLQDKVESSISSMHENNDVIESQCFSTTIESNSHLLGSITPEMTNKAKGKGKEVAGKGSADKRKGAFDDDKTGGVQKRNKRGVLQLFMTTN
ncbi:hypothetical protein JHK85_027898 [Glycine max]|nr:hypothetical protein JHK85_027898 [Glycine max]